MERILAHMFFDSGAVLLSCLILCSVMGLVYGNKPIPSRTLAWIGVPMLLAFLTLLTSIPAWSWYLIEVSHK